MLYSTEYGSTAEMLDIASLTLILIKDEMNTLVLTDSIIVSPPQLSKLESLDLSRGSGTDYFFDRRELPSMESFSCVKIIKGLPTGGSASLVPLILQSSCGSPYLVYHH